MNLLTKVRNTTLPTRPLVCSLRVKLCSKVLHLYFAEKSQAWLLSSFPSTVTPCGAGGAIAEAILWGSLLVFIWGEGVLFFFSLFWVGGILDRVPKHPLLSSHYDLWVWEKKMELAFLIFLHLSIPPACGSQCLLEGHRVGMVSFPLRPQWNAGETPK